MISLTILCIVVYDLLSDLLSCDHFDAFYNIIRKRKLSDSVL